jgi:hypothetical protein
MTYLDGMGRTGTQVVTAELDDRAVAGALDDSAVMHRNRWVDEFTAERAKPGQRTIFASVGEPAKADDAAARIAASLRTSLTILIDFEAH